MTGLADPFLLAAVIAWGLLYTQFGDRLADGYDPLRATAWEELYVVAISIPEAIIGSWGVAVAVDVLGVDGIVPVLRVTVFTALLGGALGVRWLGVWRRTLAQVDRTVVGIVRAAGFYVTVLFGVGLGIAVQVAVHPSVETLQLLYQAHINYAIYVLQSFQAILGLQVTLIQPLVAHMVAIYQNNAGLAIRAGVLGGVGGVVRGADAPLVLVMAMNASLTWGVFSGLLIRNSIAVGNGLLAAPLGYLTSTGLLVVGHTFHEFMAIVVVGTGAAVAVFGFLRPSTGRSTVGLYAVGLGFAQLGAAAFIETFISPVPVAWLKGYLTLQPTILPLQFNTGYGVAVGSVLVTTAALAVGFAWMTRTTVRVIEEAL